MLYKPSGKNSHHIKKACTFWWQNSQQDCSEMAHLPCTQFCSVDPSSPTHILTLYILSLCGFIGEWWVHFQLDSSFSSYVETHPPLGAVKIATGAAAQFVQILSLQVDAANTDGAFLGEGQKVSTLLSMPVALLLEQEQLLCYPRGHHGVLTKIPLPCYAPAGRTAAKLILPLNIGWPRRIHKCYYYFIFLFLVPIPFPKGKLFFLKFEKNPFCHFEVKWVKMSQL